MVRRWCWVMLEGAASFMYKQGRAESLQSYWRTHAKTKAGFTMSSSCPAAAVSCNSCFVCTPLLPPVTFYRNSAGAVSE